MTRNQIPKADEQLARPTRRQFVVGSLAIGAPIAGRSPRVGQVEAVDVETINGTLEKSGDDYYLDGTQVDFGPSWYLSETDTDMDYDGDGVMAGTFEDEFDGLVGAEVQLGVDADSRGDDRDVYIVDGREYRDPSDDSPPPWAGGPNGRSTPVANRYSRRV